MATGGKRTKAKARGSSTGRKSASGKSSTAARGAKARRPAKDDVTSAPESGDMNDTGFARGRELEGAPQADKTGERTPRRGRQSVEKDDVGEAYESSRRDALP